MCDKNVYVGSMSFEYVNIYSIGIDFGDFFNYCEYHNNSLLLEKNPNNTTILSKDRELLEIIVDIQNVFRNFKKLDVLPNKLWLEINKINEHPNTDEYLFMVKGGGIILRESCAKILKQFNLGQTTLTPLKIYEYETGELWSDEVFYFLNLCEHRKYFCHPPSNKKLFRKVFDIYRDDIYTNYDFIQDNQLEVDLKALNCDVDLWHDDRLGGHFFMSDSLYQSLNQAGMIDKFNPHTCKLI